jgi:hypothetical protein
MESNGGLYGRPDSTSVFPVECFNCVYTYVMREPVAALSRFVCVSQQQIPSQGSETKNSAAKPQLSKWNETLIRYVRLLGSGNKQCCGKRAVFLFATLSHRLLISMATLCRLLIDAERDAPRRSAAGAVTQFLTMASSSQERCEVGRSHRWLKLRYTACPVNWWLWGANCSS